ncbi:hypothetical protein HK405_010279, partial [Cladochytrium tenue]
SISDAATTAAPSILAIFAKVRPTAFLWGLGTSFGELPPYFIARAAAVAGRDDPDFVGIERILERPAAQRSLSDRFQVMTFLLVQNLGFFGILLCASIPNPLFDLAGIICGHFSVPFMTFWGATFVGKALVKNNLQAFGVVVMFSHGVLDAFLATVEARLPAAAHGYVSDFLQAQIDLLGGPDVAVDGKTSIVGLLWNTFLGGMVGYFALSFIEALAMQELRRQHDLELAAISDGENSGGAKHASTDASAAGAATAVVAPEPSSTVSGTAKADGAG